MPEDRADQLLDLDIDIGSLVGPGRRKKPLVFTIKREIEEADLALLSQSAAIGPIEIKKLSQRHHGLARLIAAGTSSGDAAIMMNYDASRVSVLLGDPAFQELIAFYQGQVDDAFIKTADKLAGFSNDVLDELQDRLESSPEEFSTTELTRLLTVALDRTGLGPTTKSEQKVTLNIGDSIEAARKRALEARMARARQIPDAEIIDGDGA